MAANLPIFMYASPAPEVGWCNTLPLCEKGEAIHFQVEHSDKPAIKKTCDKTCVAI
jgi:hypothetical protein